MKKIIYSIGISSLLALAITGCKQGNTEEMIKQDQEKVNSSVQAKIDELNMTLGDECNTKINEEAQKAFDALPKTAVKSPAKTPVKKPTTKPTTPPKTTTPPPNTNTGKNDGTSGTNTGKKDATTTTPGQNLGKKK
ncbi:MAG: hypothetical protein WCP57_10210 [Bacteroidota bacterium]